MVKIYHTGHAGFMFCYDKITLVTDHWSSNFKPFENSWEKLEKDNYEKSFLNKLYNPDFIWCSHEHGDHYDPTYIKSIKNKNCKIIMPNFGDKSFEKLMINDGINLEMIFLNDLDSLYLSKKFKVQIIFEEPLYTNHSSRFLNFNNKLKCFHNADTTPIDDYYKKAQENNMFNVDIFIGQYTNPTPFPWSIDMKIFDTEEEAIEMHNNYLNLFIEMNKKFNAKTCFPCAGPAIVKKHNIKKYIKADKIIFDKKSNLEYLSKNLETREIYNLKNGQKIFFDV